jgi:hypothetical protein
VIRHSLCTWFVIALFAGPTAAQGPPTLPPPPGIPPVLDPAAVPGVQTPEPATPKPGPRAATPQTPAPPMIQGPPRRRGRDVNIRIELTIGDQLGAAKPETRVVSMIVADGAFGRIRSSADNGVEKLNVDARPELLEGDRLSVELTVEYVPPRPDGAPRRPAMLNEQLTVILQSGKPMQVSQAADPLAERKTTVEVLATIVK